MGFITAHGFYLLERTDDTTVSDIGADQIYTGGLNNNGETLTCAIGHRMGLTRRPAIWDLTISMRLPADFSE